jgi:hypothetical protein
MHVPRMIMLITFVATAMAVSAENTETKPIKGGKGAPSSEVVGMIPDSCQDGGKADLLTETMGFDFGPYITQLVKTVRQDWYQIMPESVQAPVKKHAKVAIEFVVLKDGKVAGMRLHTTSGDVPLDRAAWGSITASNPFAPLPAEFTGDRLGLRLYFFYNLPPSIQQVRVSPCADVRVPAGATQQFTALGDKISNGSVTWSVEGMGCKKKACGTISNAGLYTAPGAIPKPFTIVVTATLRTNVDTQGTVTGTVTQSAPPQ